MKLGLLTAPQIRSLLEERWQRDDTAVAAGLHVADGADGPPEVDFAFGTARVVRADNVFQFRQALEAAERNGGRIILLTPLQQGDLGDDVVGRLARSRLFPVDPWASLCALFKAKDVDPSLGDAAVAQALLASVPADGYPPAPAGVLDPATVWKAVCRHVFDMGDREPDLPSLLLWAGGDGAHRWRQAAPELRAGLRRQLIERLGGVAEAILRFVDSGAGADALALAIACQVVFGEEGLAPLAEAAVRLEPFHAKTKLSVEIGRGLAGVAAQTVADLDRTDESGAVEPYLSRADRLLDQLMCPEYAWRSRATPLGFAQRAARLGAEIEAALSDLDPEAVHRCESLQKEFAAHRSARLGRGLERVRRAAMAVRLVRWLADPRQAAESFSTAAESYRQELSFVDWAREAIRRGDEAAALSQAYRRLDEAALVRRETSNNEFARLLADWSAVGSTQNEAIGVEQVLAEVVAKVAGFAPVLLVVLDGMSWAVCRELLADLRRDGWKEKTLSPNWAPLPLVVATVPSTTRCSRTSLLSGRLEAGDASVEARNFPAHPAWGSQGEKRRPKLFHKHDATDGTRGAVGEELRGAVRESKLRVVGVVLNAIDDRLASAEQIHDDWSVQRIGPLGALLQAAQDAGRVVVLASDHGHVWHRSEAAMQSATEGGRWRDDLGAPQEGELRISGPRVRGANGGSSLIALWTEKTHYGRGRNGYHGGLSPQEMLCPLVVLCDRNLQPPGLFDYECPNPEWWSPSPVPTVERLEVRPKVVVPKGPPLFAHLPPPLRIVPEVAPAEVPLNGASTPAVPGWIDRLLASETYRQQKALLRRHPPDDDRVRRTLAAIAAAGGLTTPTALVKGSGEPAARLDGWIATVQRVLNVDGYELLSMNRAENRVELNIPKLLRQFDLD